MQKLIFATVILTLSGQLFGNDETDDFCNLTRTQAEARAAVLAWPKLFGSVGIQPITQGLIVYEGINQSVSGFIQALVTNDISYYQCRFYTSNKLVMDNVLHLDDSIFLKQADAQKPILMEALKQAEVNVEIEKKLFDTQNATMTELSAAYLSKKNIRLSIAALEQKSSTIREIPLLDTELNLKDKAADAKAYEAKAAALTSKIDALSAWDVVVSGGLRHDLQANTTTGFGTANLTYSFGHIPSAIQSSKVDRLARKYLDTQYASPQNALLRQIHAQKGVLDSERINNDSIRDQVESTQELLEKVKNLDSIRAKRVQRNLSIQLLTQKAELVASTVRIDELEKWLKTNAD